MKFVSFYHQYFGEIIGVVTKKSERHTYVKVDGFPVEVQVPNSEVKEVKIDD